MSSNIDVDGAEDDIIYPSTLPFLSVHLACFAAIWSGVTWQAVALCAALYWLRIFAIGAGYHRYFSHRAYSTSRAFQFVLAFLSQTSAQKSVLWWAAKHRHHHLHSDSLQDVHSPRHHGFIYSHLGWIFARKHGATDFAKVCGSGALSRAGLAAQMRAIAGCCACPCLPACRRVVGPRRRVFLEYSARLSRDIFDQFARALSRKPAVRDGRRLPQQLAAGAFHDGRGLAQ